MRRRIITLLLLLFSLFSCQKEAVWQGSFISLINSETPSAYHNQNFYYIVDEGLNYTNLAVTKAVASSSDVILLKNGMAHLIQITNYNINIEFLASADNIYADSDFIILTEDNNIHIYQDTNTNTSTTLELEKISFEKWDTIEIWGKFLISAEQDQLSIYSITGNPIQPLDLRNEIENVNAFSVADHSPFIVYSQNGSTDIMQYNLYSGTSIKLISNTIPAGTTINRLKYYDKLQMVITIGNNSFSVYHLDTLRLEMGTIPALDAVYDNNRNILYILTDTEIIAINSISDITENINEGNYRTYSLISEPNY